MTAPKRVLTAVPPVETTSAKLRALSRRERQACWRLFGAIVEIYRRDLEAVPPLERVVNSLANYARRDSGG